MDRLAKSAMDRYEPNASQTIDKDKWQIVLPTGKVSRRFKHAIRHFISSSQLESKWNKSRKRRQQVKPPYLPSHLLELIDFEASAKAWTQLKGGMKRFVSKLASEQLPVGRYMHSMRQWRTNLCPRCLQSNETTIHVLSCQAASAQVIRATLLREVQQELNNINTDPSIVTDLLFLLRATSSSEPNILTTRTSPLIDAQLQLSPLQFLQGRLVKAWRHQQQLYYQSIESHQSALRWASKVLICIWRFAFSLWDHRNNVLHTNQSVLDKIHNLRATNDEIRRQWRLGTDGLHDMNCHLFRGNLADILKKSRRYKEKWLQQVKKARKN